MPVGVVKTKADEKKWSRAKAAVSRSRKKPQNKFTKRDWGLVMHIFKSMKRPGKARAASLIAMAIDLTAMAVAQRQD